MAWEEIPMGALREPMSRWGKALADAMPREPQAPARYRCGAVRDEAHE
jgi:hypothetical protein